MSRKFVKRLNSSLALFAFGVAASAAVVPVTAGETRDHRGQVQQHASPKLNCGAFKHCAKLGVAVRDHRRGATKNNAK